VHPALFHVKSEKSFSSSVNRPTYKNIKIGTAHVICKVQTVLIRMSHPVKIDAFIPAKSQSQARFSSPQDGLDTSVLRILPKSGISILMGVTTG
jgi:hypothetical protein